MAGFPELGDYDGLGLAELVRTRQVSPLELVEEVVARIERVNPQLNAVIHQMYDGARARARSAIAPAPFAGVPLLLKDLLADYEGETITSGSAMYRGWH